MSEGRALVPMSRVAEMAKSQVCPLLPRREAQWPEFAVALNAAIVKNPKIRECMQINPDSGVLALVKCARLGLSLNPADEHFDLIPYFGKDPKIEGQVRARGLQFLAMESGRVEWIHTDVIYRQELQDPLIDQLTQTVNHYPKILQRDGWGEADMVAAFAPAKIIGTDRLVTRVLSRGEILKRRAMARNPSAPDSPWVKHTAAMWEQKALKALLRMGRIPLSPRAKDYLQNMDEDATETRPASVVVSPVQNVELTTLQAETIKWDEPLGDAAERHLWKRRNEDPLPDPEVYRADLIESIRLLCEELGYEVPESTATSTPEQLEKMLDTLREKK